MASSVAGSSAPRSGVPYRAREPNRRKTSDLKVLDLRLWFSSIFLMISAFYAANAYQGPISQALYYGKWIFTAPVVFFSWRLIRFISKNRIRKSADISLTLLMPLLFVISTGMFLSADGKGSVLIGSSVLIGLCTAFVLAIAVAHSNGQQFLFSAVELVGRIVIFASAMMWGLGLNLGRGSADRFSGWTDNPNTLAAMLVPGLILLLAKVLSKRKQRLTWDIPFLLVGLYLLLQTGSRAGILWFCVSSVAFYAYRTGAIKLLIFSTLLFVVAAENLDVITTGLGDLLQNRATTGSIGALSGREEVWGLGFSLFMEQPIFGHGIGSSADLIMQNEHVLIHHQGLHFHNSFLTVAVELGLVGLLVVTLAIVYSIFHGLRSVSNVERRSTRSDWAAAAVPWVMVTGLLAHAFFETTIFSAGNPNMIFFWTLVFMLSSKNSERRTPRRRHQMQSRELRH